MQAQCVEPDPMDKHSRTPIALASLSCQLEMVPALAARNANSEVEDERGGIPMALAAFAGHLKVVTDVTARNANYC